MTNWKRIPAFPTYSVSDTGLVRNDDTDRIMAIRRNPHGVYYVGLMKGKKQHNLSLARLVAEAFVSRPTQDRTGSFNNPIHLNGHKDDNYAHNLMWRPYWFALKFQQQFRKGPTTAVPILEIKTQERYSCPLIAAMAFGLLEQEIISSALDRTFVWPTFQEFRFVEE
jgi:hypothetical protein